MGLFYACVKFYVQQVFGRASEFRQADSSVNGRGRFVNRRPDLKFKSDRLCATHKGNVFIISNNKK